MIECYWGRCKLLGDDEHGEGRGPPRLARCVAGISPSYLVVSCLKNRMNDTRLTLECASRNAHVGSNIAVKLCLDTASIVVKPLGNGQRDPAPPPPTPDDISTTKKIQDVIES